MDNLKQIWETHLPCWMIVYCKCGQANISIAFKHRLIKEGSVLYISPDMYPILISHSADFQTMIFLSSADFFEQSLRGIPSYFYNIIYQIPSYQCNQKIISILQIAEQYKQKAMKTNWIY